LDSVEVHSSYRPSAGWIVGAEGDVRRSADPDYVVLHRTSCKSISNDKQTAGAFTGKSYPRYSQAARPNSNSPPNAKAAATERSQSDALSAAREDCGA
jgi:hypothetical protein